MRAPSTIRTRLTAHHRSLEDLLSEIANELDGKSDGTDVKWLWGTFRSALSAHLEAEEKYSFPRLLAVRPRDGQALLAEHNHIRRRLLELGAEIELGTARHDAARSFVDELRAHARHEEALLYQWCDENLDASDQTQISKALVDVLGARRSRAPT